MTAIEEMLSGLFGGAKFEVGFFGGAGSAKHICRWHAEDGYYVSYSTSRAEGGPHHGKFVVEVHKPVGPGARTGKANRWEPIYLRGFATRKAAKARALAIYKKHSPKYAARVAA